MNNSLEQPIRKNQSFDVHCIKGNEALFFDSITQNSIQPIGVFDSGMGGLSVLQHLIQQLPSEQFIYFADSKHVPYGERTPDDIQQLTLQAVQWLYDKGCKLVVIACNSASAYSLTKLREVYHRKLQIVGLVPALKPAILATSTKRVAVLATQATLEGELLNEVIESFAVPKHVTVFKFFEPSLVPWIEAGLNVQHPTYKKLLLLVTKLDQLNVDHLVLGCTHYPFFKNLIEQHTSMNIIDSGLAVAQHVQNILTQSQGLSQYNSKKIVTTEAHLSRNICNQHNKNIDSSIKCVYYTTKSNIDYTIIDSMMGD